MWGRPSADAPTVLVAVTSERWLAGQPPGGFELEEVPAELTGRFADPDRIGGSLSAADLPAGAFVTPGLLVDPADATGSRTAMQFAANTEAWPEPGPRAGAAAVVATTLGGCALEAATLVDGGEGRITLSVDAAAAARLAAAAELGGLVVWPDAPDGWPLCEHRAASSPGPGTYTHSSNEPPVGIEVPAADRAAQSEPGANRSAGG